jgi:hypothetical protein
MISGKFTPTQISILFMFCVSAISVAICNNDMRIYLAVVNGLTGIIWLFNLVVNASVGSDINYTDQTKKNEIVNGDKIEPINSQNDKIGS